MVDTSTQTAGKPKKKPSTYRFEEWLEQDLELLAGLIGSDKTAILHRAVKLLKQSSEFQAEIEEYQKKQREAAANLLKGRADLPEKVRKSAHGRVKSVLQNVPHKKGGE